MDALAEDGAPPLTTLKVDGGVTANSFAMQFVADICDVEVVRPAFQEMTALGAARLAALGWTPRGWERLHADLPAIIEECP